MCSSTLCSKKGCHQTHGGNFVKSQPIFKILSPLERKEKEISNKLTYYFPSYLKYVAAIPVGIQKLKFVVKLPKKIKTLIIFVKNESFIHI